MSEPKPTTFLAPRSAAVFCGALIAGFACVVGFSVIDHPKTATAEAFSQTTAAGDDQFYTPPSPQLAVPEPVLTWQGKAWAPVNYEKSKIDDPDMTRVGTDEKTGLSLYQPRGKQSGDTFIKIAIGEYLRVAPR